MYRKIIKNLQKLKNSGKAKILQGFFKTDKGEYGEGDVFLGIVVPLQRQVAKKYFPEASLTDLQKLLNSKIHEYRLVALLMLVAKSGDLSLTAGDKIEKNKEQIFDFYLKNTKNINNWDLVDLSAPNIVGNFLLDKDTKILYKLATSKNLWERRIAVISTFAFIKENQFIDTLKIAELLLNDKHDLIHKAVGWMLREVGKRDIKSLENFLNKHYKTMPRTMLRYAIEKLPENKRKKYLKK